jgi:hypothetical protein
MGSLEHSLSHNQGKNSQAECSVYFLRLAWIGSFKAPVISLLLIVLGRVAIISSRGILLATQLFKVKGLPERRSWEA